MSTLVSRLTAMIELKTTYRLVDDFFLVFNFNSCFNRIANNPNFHIFKGTKKHYMEKAKEEGLGRNAGQAPTLSIAVGFFIVFLL